MLKVRMSASANIELVRGLGDEMIWLLLLDPPPPFWAFAGMEANIVQASRHAHAARAACRVIALTGLRPAARQYGM
jgi:hypothetical protein